MSSKLGTLTLAALCVAAFAMPSMGNPIPHFEDVETPEVPETPDGIEVCEKAAECVLKDAEPPACPDKACENPCLPSGVNAAPTTTGEVCGVMLPQPDPVEPVVPQCQPPQVCEHPCFEKVQATQTCDPQDFVSCSFTVQATDYCNDPCTDDVVKCPEGLVERTAGNCGSLAYIGTFTPYGGPNRADLYAKRAGGAYPSDYDIYASWSMSGATLTVGADEYSVVFRLRNDSGQHDTLTGFPARYKDGPCYFIGRVTGNAFSGTVLGGAAGSASTQGCEWGTSFSKSISKGAEIEFSSTGGANGKFSISNTTTLGSSTTCTDNTLFDSEVLLATVDQSFEIPYWRVW